MKKKSKIVSLGYFGHRNAGDDLLQSTISDLFSDHDIMFSSWFPGTNLINSADAFVIGGGSLWPGLKLFRHARALSNNLRIPIFVIGISASRSNEDVMRESQELINKANFFHVRDKISVELIGNNPKITQGVDLFWWSKHELDDYSGCIDNNSIALNLRSWDKLKWQACEIVEIVNQLNYSINPWPLYFGSRVHEAGDNPTDVEILQKVVNKDLPSSFSIRPLLNSKFCICMRFHAVLMSVRAGRPTIGFDYHSKLKYFYDEHDISELCVPLDDLQKLINAIELIEKNYERYRKIFSNIRDHCIAQGKTDRALFQSSLDTIKPKSRNRIFRHLKSQKQLLKQP